MSDYGRLTVQITPLIDSGGDIDSDDFLEPEQVFDVEVTHPLNEGRSAKASLSMEDPLVEDLRPWQQGLRIKYHRPGEVNNDEPVFWGQANVIDDFENGRVTLEAVDPSVRMQHHYVRIGDDALNDPADNQRGRIYPDYRGIDLLVDAAQAAPGYPVLGCVVEDVDSIEDTQKIDVERGQEVWQMILDICAQDTGPDFDMATKVGPGAGPGVYATLRLYERLGSDLSTTVKFDYGDDEDWDTPTNDNAPSIVVTPGHPTTHVHVVDTDRSWRVTGFTPDYAEEHGMWVDWVATDWKIKDSLDVNVLKQYAKAHIKAYGIPPKQTEVRLRLDSGAVFFYGDPGWPDGNTVGDFYIGDSVKVRAKRGYREVNKKYRITQVVLSQPGARGPMQTQLTLIPSDVDIDVTLDVDET